MSSPMANGRGRACGTSASNAATAASSTASIFRIVDDRKDRLRDMLIEKYPDVAKRANVGWKPNNALYHAETTLLLRLANENGGSLAGRTLVMHVDETMCPSCKELLPYIGLELGNPSVTFVDHKGR